MCRRPPYQTGCGCDHISLGATGGLELNFASPPPLDWGLLEDRHFACFLRPVTPRVGGVLPPQGPRTGSWSHCVIPLCSLTNGLTLSGWEVKVEGGRGERSVPKMFSPATCYLRSERKEQQKYQRKHPAPAQPQSETFILKNEKIFFPPSGFP